MDTLVSSELLTCSWLELHNSEQTYTFLHMDTLIGGCSHFQGVFWIFPLILSLNRRAGHLLVQDCNSEQVGFVEVD